MEDILSYAGNDLPVREELDLTDLNVIGRIPPDLSGVYMRNGPNPFFLSDDQAVSFDGDGMIHAIYLQSGKAHYRNRYIETKALLKERRAGKALYSSIINPKPLDPAWADPGEEWIARKNSASMNVISHGGKYLALLEGHPPYEITAELKTIGEWKPHDFVQPFSVGAHTRSDPLTGELWFINYGFFPPFLTAYCVDRTGQFKKKIIIEKDQSTMIHDFVLTKHYLIVFDCPLLFDFKRLTNQQSILHWQPELKTRIGLIPRHSDDNHDHQDIKWFSTEPFFVFHFANAYEEDKTIIIDYVRHEHAEFFSEKNPSTSKPRLYRTVIDLHSEEIKHSSLANAFYVEFPFVNKNKHAKPHQFIYALSKMDEQNALVKLDVLNQNTTFHAFSKHEQLSEAVFVPSQNTTEESGYLLLLVYDFMTHHTELLILDAANLEQLPLARIQIPCRIPRGFHGSWTSYD